MDAQDAARCVRLFGLITRIYDRTRERLRTRRELHNVKTEFLQLPPEIRNEIYYEVLENQQYTSFHLSGRTQPFGTVLFYSDGRNDRLKLIKLPHICHAVRRETIPLLFGNMKCYLDLWNQARFREAINFISSMPKDIFTSLRRFSIDPHMSRIFESANDYRDPAIRLEIDLGSTTSPAIQIVERDSRKVVVNETKSEYNELASKVLNDRPKRDLSKEGLMELLRVLRPVERPPVPIVHATRSI